MQISIRSQEFELAPLAASHVASFPAIVGHLCPKLLLLDSAPVCNLATWAGYRSRPRDTEVGSWEPPRVLCVQLRRHLAHRLGVSGPGSGSEHTPLRAPPPGLPSRQSSPLRGWGTVNCLLPARTGSGACVCPAVSFRCARRCWAMCSSFFSRSCEREMKRGLRTSSASCPEQRACFSFWKKGHRDAARPSDPVATPIESTALGD